MEWVWQSSSGAEPLHQVRVAGAERISEAQQSLGSAPKGFSLPQEHPPCPPGITWSVNWVFHTYRTPQMPEDKPQSLPSMSLWFVYRHTQGMRRAARENDYLPNIRAGSGSSEGSVEPSRAYFLTEKVDYGYSYLFYQAACSKWLKNAEPASQNVQKRAIC